MLFLMLYVLLSRISMSTANDCGTFKADIVFLLDSSYSETREDFSMQLIFVKNFTQGLDIGLDKVQISVVTFDTTPVNAFYLNVYQDKTSLLNAIGSVQQPGGRTQTDKGLKFVRENSFQQSHGGRRDVKRVLVVVTDGQSDDPNATRTEAGRLHRADIEVISVGIGRAVDTSELKAIATDDAHSFSVPTFDALKTLQSSVQAKACAAQLRCSIDYADLVFVVDVSERVGVDNIQTTKNFLKALIRGINIGPQHVHVGVVQYASTPSFAFHLNDHLNASSVLSAIDGLSVIDGGANNVGAYLYAKREAFQPYNGGRNSVQQLMILLSAGPSGFLPPPDLFAAHNDQIPVIAVGIGDENTLKPELLLLTDDAAKIFITPNYSSLGSTVSSVLEAACNATVLECANKELDIVFILDASSSQGYQNFKKQVQFVGNFVQMFSVGPNDTQFGMISYSYGAHNDFYLNTYRDSNSILQRLQKILFLQGARNTDLALRTAHLNQFAAAHGARSTSLKFAILLTTGRPMESGRTIMEAEILRRLGVQIIPVGIGDTLDTQALQKVASSQNYALHVGKFDQLGTMLKKIKNITCTVAEAPKVNSGMCMTSRIRLNVCHYPGCGTRKVDMVFVLDSSGSEGPTNFGKQLDFVKDFVQQFQIGPDNVQLSVVTFSSNTREEFPLNRYQDKRTLLNAISNVRYHDGGTYTHEALDYVRQNSFLSSHGGRPGASGVVVTLTDGASNRPQMTKVSANLLKARPGIIMISIGIGSNINKQELDTLASDNNHSFSVQDFDSLQNVKMELTYAACETCEFVEKADIVFLLDASSSEGQLDFDRQLQFVERVVSSFTIGPANVQIGIVTFSDRPHREFDLNSYQTKEQILTALQRIGYAQGQTNMDKAFQFVKEVSFTKVAGARPDGKKYLIILTDGESNNISKTLVEADNLKRRGVDIIAIGIGGDVDKRELERIATDENHVMLVNSFDTLDSVAKDVKKTACEAKQVPSEFTTTSTTQTTIMPTTTPTTPTTPTSTTTPTTTSTTTRPTTSPKPVCRTTPVDLVFVLDSSGSEGETNFRKQLDFVKNFVLQFSIGPHETQVSVVTFSSDVREEFPLNQYTNSISLLTAILKVPYVSGSTQTGMALKYVRAHSFHVSHGGRQNAKHVIIILTDGISSNPTQTKSEASLLKRQSSLTLVSIGIGPGVNQRELQEIASDKRHTFRAQDFNNLQPLKAELTVVTCQ